MKKLVETLASLKLAVFLLVVLLIGLSAGTILESRTDAATAGRLVYYSWWFLGLQGLFAVNVACSIANLFPWGGKRVGFVMTHASLLLIFAGAALTYFGKVEGQLGLWEGESGATAIERDSQGRVISRHELPFSVKLDDFVLETYQGTMRPSGFASQVVVTDTDTGKSFPARIWMNTPLHHRGWSLFQSSYQQDGGREATVLSVSKDPGQLVVFAGYATLVLGMILVLLTRVSQMREREAFEAKIAAGGMSLPTMGRSLLVALTVLPLATSALAAGPANIESLKRLPVQHDGRVMPLDTLARETVWTVTGSHSWNGEDPATTFTGWLFDPQSAAKAPVVKLGSKALAAAAGIDPSAKHVSFEQLVGNPRLMQLVQAAGQAASQDKPRTGVLKDAEKLEHRLSSFYSVLQRDVVRPIPAPGDARARWNLPLEVSPEALLSHANGLRLPGWPSAKKIDGEILYNRINPSRLSWVVLLASLAVSIAAWVRSSRLLDGVSFALLILGFAAMSWGIGMRWAAGERIPAANMYESLLFLAWGVGLFAVVAYALLKNRVVVVNAAAMSALTMALTDLLPMDRFIHPIAPVLAGTPWLAIHVPIIMVGYAVLALGLVVAHMQIGFAAFGQGRGALVEKMYELLYWYMFVGSIFLLAGILTGSVWAASSWGRYWGWDPKEVWSLVAFLAYMAILHLKVDKVIGTFGVAVISIAAFQTILMTYLGVNFVLNIGMHSYGMGDSPVVKWMIVTALVELVFLVVAGVAWRDRKRMLAAA
ncbi:MAG TPA: cytochrome c biogenesis protein CcsA [Thermoanaerobaculia bacterium]|nr:cytochrome c biogenesis protein CcsA [Thermoanaerobaculia bacterium]